MNHDELFTFNGKVCSAGRMDFNYGVAIDDGCPMSKYLPYVGKMYGSLQPLSPSHL